MAKNSVVKNDASREVAQQQGRNAYQAFADEVRQTGIEGSLLRFTKSGDWIAGQEEEDIPEGTELIMGLNTLKRGWVKWADQKPVDSRMGLVSEGFRPCNREELGDLDEDEWEKDDDDNSRDPWQDTMQVLLKDPESGEVYTYATASKSGKTALGEVAQVYGDRLQDGEDPDAMPVIKLASSFYKHKTYGRIMIPVFEMTDQWLIPPTEPAPAAKGKNTKGAAGKGKDKPGKGNQAASGKGAGAARNAGAASGRTPPKALPAPRKPAGNGNRARI